MVYVPASPCGAAGRAGGVCPVGTAVSQTRSTGTTIDFSFMGTSVPHLLIPVEI
jgi:hypothetical protein